MPAHDVCFPGNQIKICPAFKQQGNGHSPTMRFSHTRLQVPSYEAILPIKIDFWTVVLVELMRACTWWFTFAGFLVDFDHMENWSGSYDPIWSNLCHWTLSDKFINFIRWGPIGPSDSDQLVNPSPYLKQAWSISKPNLQSPFSLDSFLPWQVSTPQSPIQRVGEERRWKEWVEQRVCAIGLLTLFVLLLGFNLVHSISHVAFSRI